MVNIHDTPPFVAIDDNICVSRTGDVIFCYEMTLPEKHSLSNEGYDGVLTTLARALRPFEQDTVIHQANYFQKCKYDSSKLPSKSYLQKTFKDHHSKKYHTEHKVYFFFTWTLSDIIIRDEFINPFKRISNEKEILEKINETHFKENVENAISYVNSTKNEIDLRKLNRQDIEKVCRAYFNGLLPGVYTDVENDKEKGIKIGERFTDIYTVHSLKQLPVKITNTIFDSDFSTEERKFYQGLTEPFGISIPYDHIVNQIIFIPSNKRLFSVIQNKQEEFHSSRGFPGNADPAKNIASYLQRLRDNKGGTKLVQSHFNVIVFTDSEREREEARQKVRSTFTDSDITPYEPKGNALKGIYINSFFGFSARMPKRFTFIAELELAISFLIQTSTYRDDPDGIWFFDRNFNVPLKRDIWDAGKKRFKARNFFIIAPTGQGKSTLCNHIIYQLIEQGYKVVINDLGKSYQNLYRHYKNRSVMLDFQPGQPMNINPFETDNPEKIDSEFILYLNDLINLFHFKGTIASDKIPTNHNTAIRKIIDAYYKNLDKGFNMKSFYKFFEFIHKNKRYEEIGIDPSVYDPSKTMGDVLFSLTEFGTDQGIYSYLFDIPKDDRKLFRITPDTDFAYFEFDRAGEDAMLQAILQQYSFQATRKVVWEDKSKRGIMLNDEYAKLLKFPQVAASTEYTAQTIRKYNGGAGFVIQSVVQLPKTDTIGSILDNTSLFYILPTDKSHIETAERLNLTDHHRYLLDSIESNLTGSMPYTEVFLLFGKFAQVVRNQLPIEHFYSFQTEGNLYNVIEDVYKKYNDMPRTIEEVKLMYQK
jgi:conjugal transfer ATP-binding protein TraC